MVFTDCPVHGRLAVKGVIGGSGIINMVGNVTKCPVVGCGRIVPIVDGTYELRDNIIQSFRAASMEDLEAFRDIRNAVAHGTISKEQAEKQVAGLGGNLSQVWAWANANPALFSILGMLLSVAIMWWTLTASDQSSAEQHEDALHLQAATRSVVQAIETETRVSELERDTLRRIYVGLQKQPVGGASPQQQALFQSLARLPSQTRVQELGSKGGKRRRRREAGRAHHLGKKR